MMHFSTRSTVGKNESGPHVAVICEYDALPEIGHACGHNLIAEAGLGAGLGIKAALDSVDGKLGRVSELLRPQYDLLKLRSQIVKERTVFFWKLWKAMHGAWPM